MKNRSWASRRAAAFGTTIALSLALVACGSSEDPEDGTEGDNGGANGGEAAEHVTIEFWATPFWGNDEDRTRQAVDEFNELHDGSVTVELTQLQWQDGRDIMKQAVAAGTGPDVLVMNTGLDLDYLTAGRLASLPDLGYTQEDLDQYLPVAGVNEYEGAMYGVPLFFDTVVLYYRSDVLADHGFDGAPATWDELKETAAAITAGTDEQIWGWQFKGMDDHLNAIHSTWQSFLWQAGGQFLTDDFSASAQNSPAGEEAMTFMRSFYEEGISPVGTSAQSGFVSGDIAMFNFYQTLHVDETPGEWAIAPMPAGPENGASLIGGHSLVANADSDHLAAAGEFMRFLASPEHAVEYMEDFRGIFPFDRTRVSAEVADAVDGVIADDPNWVSIIEQLDRAEPAMLQQDRIANSARWNAQAANVIAGVSGQTSVPDALSALDAEINEALGG